MLLEVGQLYERSAAIGDVTFVRALSCVEPGVLLDVRQLFESPITIRTFVRLLTRVNSDVLHQLVVAREGLETLLTLMRLHLGSASDALSAELHCRLGHQILSVVTV